MTAPALLVSIIVLGAAAILRPTRAACPYGYDLRTGIRRSGAFECWPHPVAPVGWDVNRLGPIDDWDGTWQRPERAVQPDGIIAGRLYCTGGTRPIVVNWRVVGCQR